MQMEVTSELDREPDEENIIAEGYHEAGDRRVEIEYVDDGDEVITRFTYFLDGDEFAEAETSIEVENGEMRGKFWYGMSVDEFVENHFHADPEAEIGEIFDDMLEQN